MLLSVAALSAVRAAFSVARAAFSAASAASATAFSVLQANATPVFADVDSSTFQIDVKSIVDRISDKTKAVMSVALYGGSPDYAAIIEAIGE